MKPQDNLIAAKCFFIIFILILAFVSSLTAQSNVYEFKTLIETTISNSKKHREKGKFSVNISRDETKMTIYWDLDDTSDHTDFDLLYKKDTIINTKKCTCFTGSSCAFRDYSVFVYYPVKINDIREFHIIDKKDDTYYFFNQ